MSAGPPDEGKVRGTGDDRLSIGQRLAAARIKHELSAEIVAHELNLDVAVVHALENDDRDALPAAIFVQGYLRNYARLVGLPGDDLAKDYAALSAELPPLTVVRVDRKPPLLRLPSARLIRNIILVLLAVILLWLAYPFVERLLTSRGQPEEAAAPGHLELPPASPAVNPGDR